MRLRKLIAGRPTADDGSARGLGAGLIDALGTSLPGILGSTIGNYLFSRSFIPLSPGDVLSTAVAGISRYSERSTQFTIRHSLAPLVLAAGPVGQMLSAGMSAASATVAAADIASYVVLPAALAKLGTHLGYESGTSRRAGFDFCMMLISRALLPRVTRDGTDSYTVKWSQLTAAVPQHPAPPEVSPNNVIITFVSQSVPLEGCETVIFDPAQSTDNHYMFTFVCKASDGAKQKIGIAIDFDAEGISVNHINGPDNPTFLEKLGSLLSYDIAVDDARWDYFQSHKTSILAYASGDMDRMFLSFCQSSLSSSSECRKALEFFHESGCASVISGQRPYGVLKGPTSSNLLYAFRDYLKHANLPIEVYTRKTTDPVHDIIYIVNSDLLKTQAKFHGVEGTDIADLITKVQKLDQYDYGRMFGYNHRDSERYATRPQPAISSLTVLEQLASQQKKSVTHEMNDALSLFFDDIGKELGKCGDTRTHISVIHRHGAALAQKVGLEITPRDSEKLYTAYKHGLLPALEMDCQEASGYKVLSLDEECNYKWFVRTFPKTRTPETVKDAVGKVLRQKDTACSPAQTSISDSMLRQRTNRLSSK